MAQTHDTIDRLLAEFRGYSHGMPDSYHVTMSWADFRKMLDRFEAAHRREVEALKQRINELNAEVAAKDAVIKRLNDAIAEDQRRKMATTENPSAVGNSAKLREALSKSCAYFAVVLNTGMFNRVHLEALLNMAKAALAAPPRNCDVYNSESCRLAYHLHGDGLMTMQAFADWLYASATEQEGGANG